MLHNVWQSSSALPGINVMRLLVLRHAPEVFYHAFISRRVNLGVLENCTSILVGLSHPYHRLDIPLLAAH